MTHADITRRAMEIYLKGKETYREAYLRAKAEAELPEGFAQLFRARDGADL